MNQNNRVLQHLQTKAITDYSEIQTATGLTPRQIKACISRLRAKGVIIRTHNYGHINKVFKLELVKS